MNKIKNSFILFITALVLSLTGCLPNDGDSGISVVSNVGDKNLNSSDIKNTGLLNIYYVNVGQADSIIIQFPDKSSMLIDAGETINNAVINKIDELGITKLDTVVATHPHNDHISEMPSVLKKYEIGNFYLPKVSHTSNVFETMIDIVSEKSINVKEAKAGETITVPEGFKCDIIAPCGNNYSSLNDWSAVIRLVYGNTSFLFTGDAEELSEREILEKGYNVSADILKLGHHGSSTSTCNDFLDAVNPKYAIVSAGKDNSYGHPHKETISKLNEKNIQTFITYDCGTVTATSDGNNIHKD